MSIKNTLVYSVVASLLIFFSSIALAGAPDVDDYQPTYTGVYLEGNAGYAIRDWRPSEIALSPFANSSITNAKGGFIFGFDMGYQFNQYFSLEGGWYYFPQPNGDVLQRAIWRAHICGWAAYLGGKFSIPLYEKTYLFGKLAATYYYNTSTRALPTTLSIQRVGRVATAAILTGTRTHYFDPIFAMGIQYYFNENFSINVQYMYMPSFDKRSIYRFAVPEAHIFTAGLGYKFAI